MIETLNQEFDVVVNENDQLKKEIELLKEKLGKKEHQDTLNKLIIELSDVYEEWWTDYNYTVGKKGYEHRQEEWMVPWGETEPMEY